MTKSRSPEVEDLRASNLLSRREPRLLHVLHLDVRSRLIRIFPFFFYFHHTPFMHRQTWAMELTHITSPRLSSQQQHHDAERIECGSTSPQELKPVDGGRDAWMILIAGIVYEAIFWGK